MTLMLTTNNNYTTSGETTTSITTLASAPTMTMTRTDIPLDMVRWYTILKLLVMMLRLQTPRATLTNTTKLCLQRRVSVCSHNCINVHAINVLNGWEWLYVNGAVLGKTFTKTSKQHWFNKELVISTLYPYPYIYWHRFLSWSMCKSFVIVIVMWPNSWSRNFMMWMEDLTRDYHGVTVVPDVIPRSGTNSDIH